MRHPSRRFETGKPEVDPKKKISRRAREFHKFASQYGWDWWTYLKQPNWLIKECLLIFEEGANSLSEFIDLDELKGYKNLLRSKGLTDDDIGST